MNCAPSHRGKPDPWPLDIHCVAAPIGMSWNSPADKAFDLGPRRAWQSLRRRSTRTSWEAEAAPSRARSLTGSAARASRAPVRATGERSWADLGGRARRRLRMQPRPESAYLWFPACSAEREGLDACRWSRGSLQASPSRALGVSGW